MGKYKDFILYMLQWVAAFVVGLWEMLRHFMRQPLFAIAVVVLLLFLVSC